MSAPRSCIRRGPGARGYLGVDWCCQASSWDLHRLPRPWESFTLSLVCRCPGALGCFGVDITVGPTRGRLPACCPRLEGSSPCWTASWNRAVGSTWRPVRVTLDSGGSLSSVVSVLPDVGSGSRRGLSLGRAPACEACAPGGTLLQRWADASSSGLQCNCRRVLSGWSSDVLSPDSCRPSTGVEWRWVSGMGVS